MKLALRIAGSAAILFIAFLMFSRAAFAQLGPSGSAAAAPSATSLPLSGRTAQSGSVTATQSPIPGTTTSVNTLNPTIEVQGAYAGSVSGAQPPFSGKLSLQEAVERGIKYNLGAVGMAQAVRQASGQSKIARSALLPNISGYLQDTEEQTNLAAFGLRFKLSPSSGFSIPTIVGPFNYFDLRAQLTQSVYDLTARNNYRASQETLRASEFSVDDARDLVVLAVGGAYLQVIAAQARVDSARAQLDTANALYQQTLQQFQFGRVPQLDVNRSKVEVLTQQQRLSSLQNDANKQKVNLARLTGLPPTELYAISDDIPFSPAPPLVFEDALKQALAQRSDLKAAQAQVRAAEREQAAAHAEHLPSLAASANYGDIGTSPESHGTFSAVATLNIPIWAGGRVSGDIEQAQAALAQRQAELDDLKGQIGADIRNAFSDLQAASSQVDVAQQNLEVTRQTLDQTRQRLEAGVSNNVELVQSQESVADAELDYINSVFAHNVAKLNLARAMGQAADSLPQYLKTK
jgi:outer membrane protein TolC